MAARGRFLQSAASYLVLWRNRRDVALTALAALYFLACAFCVCLANSYADRVAAASAALLAGGRFYSAPDVLVDSMRDLYMRHAAVRHLPDRLVFVAAGTGLLFCLGRARRSFALLRRYLVAAGSVYLLRAPFVAFTVLPSPFELCPVTYEEDVLYDAVLLLAQVRVSCGDVFFR
ncbi:MAG: hypothetical protein BJ554DRAFT_7485 [Olpidium bornovanus]|uniref:Uncharacterized protein n=1 Tax=Olpidium bornovanus TaxID=278681 RepID=A0A8H8DJ36_9FUNG|nr:MAG: hypothetical protein BJ554DRAFT_7485 [Olpidium bornovanus]